MSSNILNIKGYVNEHVYNISHPILFSPNDSIWDPYKVVLSIFKGIIHQIVSVFGGLVHSST